MEMADVTANMGSANYAAVRPRGGRVELNQSDFFMIQVQTFLKNYLAQFSIGTGSGQTEFSTGYYYGSGASGYFLYYHQTLSGVRGLIDNEAYVGGNNARLDKLEFSSFLLHLPRN